MAEAEETNGKNRCGCLEKKTHKGTKEDCTDTHCKLCKVCCTDECPGCEKHCTQPDKCKCRLFRCGCPSNCYGTDGDDKECNGMLSCDRCKTKCTGKKLGDRCICANCSCGCGYGLCNCCPWCKRNSCPGVCDGYVIGRCASKEKCKGHYSFEGVDDAGVAKKCGGDVLSATAQFHKDGRCMYKCTACGRLCAKHICHCIGSIFIAIGAIFFTIFIAWNKYPEKFRRVYYDLRGAFNTAPGNPGRSLNNLSGDRLPDVNVDRYPAFRPRTYAGLS